jgi:DNA-binding LacI/PurR family transcriptional regulator
MPQSPRTANRVTAADIARSLGLSRATVGFVLNNTPGQTISEATTRRVLDEAKRLGYRPHSAARALASGRSHIALLVLPDWPLDYSMQTHLDEASLELDRAGYSLVTMTPHPDGHAAPLWEKLDPDVILSMTPVSDERFAEIQASGAVSLIPGRGSDEVGHDLRFEDGPRVQVEHLVELGYSTIAFAGPADPRVRNLADARFDLAERVLTELTGHGFAARESVGEDDAATLVSRWREQDVEAVVAYNDEVAALVLAASLRQGIRVPEELAIVGHDDAPISRIMVPAISTVRVDAAGLGRFVAAIALSAVKGTEFPSAGPASDVHLVRRETT